MGNSLHNKIYLGRRPSTKRMQFLLLLGAIAGAAVFWLATH